MHESEWRDWVRQYLGGLEAQIAASRSLETRVAALEGKWREAEARRRDGRPWEAEGIRPIGVVPKAEVGRISVSPAVRVSRIGGRVVLAGIPDGDAYTLSASEARRRGSRSRIGMESAPSNLTAARD